MAFTKYPAVVELEERHGVDFGGSYKTEESATQFIKYIAESQRCEFLDVLSTCNFYSILMDGSTDSGNIENEVIVVLYSVRNQEAHQVRTFARYFSVEVPKKADAQGLIRCVGESLKKLGVEDILDKTSILKAVDSSMPVLIGVGTDGAAVNISSQNGMMGRMQQQIPRLFWAWCYAHRLELACKDAFKSPLFSDITDTLLKLFYLYSKSPKKMRQLGDIVENLREVFHFPEGGDKPLRSQGSR